MSLGRRRLLGVIGAGALGALGTLTEPAWAGSYLDRASLLVLGASKSLALLRKRLRDKEFANVVQRLALARVRVASEMYVPKEVVQAHPHLLLMLENHERAANAAREGKPKEYFQFARLARDEQEVFTSILKHLGWSLPDFTR